MFGTQVIEGELNQYGSSSVFEYFAGLDNVIRVSALPGNRDCASFWFLSSGEA